ncbi:GPI ethanolamine phosphate transferase 1 [Paragonimus skrjabini miyazakii]|uniref:GPI ethanolamine phosphate transferase 1 n=1 Tax=Paragonimus skrjabini miyazakii TaxID=59628 RepID=A0A8S9YGV8_9TREM|nr:GPI ethanolamine phosphate transferase 1 [Paragonimus skrjabini miyazakii]
MRFFLPLLESVGNMINAKKMLGFCSIIGIYLTLFYSIFVVYYTSPLVHGSVPIPLNTTPLATHLVFMITDGMRADKLFGSKMENAPFIKDLLLNQGAWGLSHTRVPTESRPGHIAMLGGFYEDVASVTKGWQANAVEFDSLLNRSQRAWAWGTHEVVEAFGLGTSNHVQVKSSPSELSDLAKHNLTDIDRWTVDQFVVRFSVPFTYHLCCSTSHC